MRCFVFQLKYLSYGIKPYYLVKELSGCEVVNKLHLTLDIYQLNEMAERVK